MERAEKLGPFKIPILNLKDEYQRAAGMQQILELKLKGDNPEARSIQAPMIRLKKYNQRAKNFPTLLANLKRESCRVGIVLALSMSLNGQILTSCFCIKTLH